MPVQIHKLCSLKPSAKVLNISNLNPSTKSAKNPTVKLAEPNFIQLLL